MGLRTHLLTHPPSRSSALLSSRALATPSSVVRSSLMPTILFPAKRPTFVDESSTPSLTVAPALEQRYRLGRSSGIVAALAGRGEIPALRASAHRFTDGSNPWPGQLGLGGCISVLPLASKNKPPSRHISARTVALIGVYGTVCVRCGCDRCSRARPGDGWTPNFVAP